MERILGKGATVKQHDQVKYVCVENGILSLIVDSKNIHRELKHLSPLLAAATMEEQKGFEVSPSGYGIHWPLIDEDISIDALLGIVHEPSANKKSA